MRFTKDELNVLIEILEKAKEDLDMESSMEYGEIIVSIIDKLQYDDMKQLVYDIGLCFGENLKSIYSKRSLNADDFVDYNMPDNGDEYEIYMKGLRDSLGDLYDEIWDLKVKKEEK